MKTINEIFPAFTKKAVVSIEIGKEFIDEYTNADIAGKWTVFPMLADTSKSLSEELGILESNEKIAYRATYIIDPEGTIQYVTVNALNVGRNVVETIRILDALQTGELTPCDWVPGEATL